MTTLNDLLYPDATSAQAEVEATLRNHNLLRVPSPPGLVPEVARALLAFLDRPVGNLAITAYDKHRLIEKAKRNTAGSWGTRETVELTRHTIQVQERPKIEIEIGGASTTVLELELLAELNVETMTAVVEFGKVVAVTPGKATATVTLRGGNVVLARAEHQLADLSASVSGPVPVGAH